jgi:hypothetical protein
VSRYRTFSPSKEIVDNDIAGARATTTSSTTIITTIVTIKTPWPESASELY